MGYDYQALSKVSLHGLLILRLRPFMLFYLFPLSSLLPHMFTNKCCREATRLTPLLRNEGTLPRERGRYNGERDTRIKAALRRVQPWGLG